MTLSRKNKVERITELAKCVDELNEIKETVKRQVSVLYELHLSNRSKKSRGLQNNISML